MCIRVSSSDPAFQALLNRQIHFVCGKGGVGKSTVSCALAQSLRRSNKQVLLAQINATDSHQHLLNIRRASDELLEVEPGLFTVNTTPEQSLKEYALMTLKFEALYKATFDNPMMRLFLRFVPSISEITMLGKLWFHAEQLDDEGPRFDHLVIDCPSTGHGIAFLRVSQILTDIMRTGPAAKKSRAMQRTFEDPSRSALHIVTLAEEMPVNESIEFATRVSETKVAPLGALFVNQIETPYLSQNNVTLEGDGASMQVLKDRLMREQLQARQQERLKEKLGDLVHIALPKVRGDAFERAAIDHLATKMWTS